MTAEVQPVCDRCAHTQLEHSAGPCHQRSAAGVGCDCGGWAEIVTGGDDAATQPAPSGDPIDTDEMIATWRPAPPPDDVLALCDEVDRLRAVIVTIPRHSWDHLDADAPHCVVCDERWPCPTEQAHRLLEADRD